MVAINPDTDSLPSSPPQFTSLQNSSFIPKFPLYVSPLPVVPLRYRRACFVGVAREGRSVWYIKCHFLETWKHGCECRMQVEGDTGEIPQYRLKEGDGVLVIQSRSDARNQEQSLSLCIVTCFELEETVEFVVGWILYLN